MIHQALRMTLESATIDEKDQAVVELALAYAKQIDEEGELSKLGPQLLACLEALLMTPKSRAAVMKGADREPASSPLDELRQRRRQRGATPVDATAT